MCSLWLLCGPSNQWQGDGVVLLFFGPSRMIFTRNFDAYFLSMVLLLLFFFEWSRFG